MSLIDKFRDWCKTNDVKAQQIKQLEELDALLAQIPEDAHKADQMYNEILKRWEFLSDLPPTLTFIQGKHYISTEEPDELKESVWKPIKIDESQNLKVNIAEIDKEINIDSENKNLKYYVTPIYHIDVTTHEINLNFIAKQIYVSYDVASLMDRHIYIANKDRPVNEDCSIEDPDYTHYKYQDILCPAKSCNSFAIDMDNFEGMNYLIDGGDGYTDYRFFFLNKKVKISNIPYADSWEDVKDIAPSKNAVYDKIEELTAGFSLCFKTINCPAGTDPIADAVADILNLTSSGDITITGNATTDTVDFSVTKYTDAEVEDIIDAEIAAGQSIDNAIDALILIHKNISDAHHGKTTAGELNHNDLANLNAGVDYEHITQTQKDALHARYEDSEAVDAMGAKANDNPLHHDRTTKYTDGEVENIITAELVNGQSIDNRIDALLTANADGYQTQVNVESLIDAECVDGESIDLAIDALINAHNVANRHLDHSTISVIAGTGLSGGGTIAANRTINCDITQYTNALAKAAAIQAGAFGVGWNGNTMGATKDAIYDKIITMAGGQSLDEVFDVGKIIDGANSLANAVQIGNGTDFIKIYVDPATNFPYITTDQPWVLIRKELQVRDGYNFLVQNADNTKYIKMDCDNTFGYISTTATYLHLSDYIRLYDGKYIVVYDSANSKQIRLNADASYGMLFSNTTLKFMANNQSDYYITMAANSSYTRLMSAVPLRLAADNQGTKYIELDYMTSTYGYIKGVSDNYWCLGTSVNAWRDVCSHLYSDASPFPKDLVLDKLLQIKSDDKNQLIHDSLPTELRAINPETKEIEPEFRNMGANISYNTKGIQELYNIIQIMQQEIEVLKNA